MNFGWHFDKIGEMGGAHDGAYRNPLTGSGLEAEHLLARESIQNSVDARREGEVVEVRFRLDTPSSERLQGLGNAIGLLEAGGPIERSMDAEDFGLSEADFFEAQLDADRKPQNILYIEDFGTHGLGGPSDNSDTNNPDSRYYRLLLGFGVADDTDTSRGGSFGFGKSVYWASSEVNTVAFYSVFDPASAPDREHARLIVAGLYKTHRYEGTPYEGRAWYGDIKTETHCAPIVDAEAHELAKELGFTVRANSDLGTSVMVLGCNLDLDRIREGVENHWWPRLVDGGLKVEFRANGDLAPPPAPSSKPHLATYIKAYRMAEDREHVESDEAFVRRANKHKSHEVGWTAVVPADSSVFHGAGERDHDRKPMYPDINEVALIRTPRMVVTYYEVPADAGDAGVVGVFVADDDIDPILKRSEPPEHTRWDMESGRLRGDEEKALVGGIAGRVKRVARLMKNRLAGPVEELPGRPRALEHMLGQLFGSRGGGTHFPPPPPDPSVFSVGRPVCNIEVSHRGHKVSGYSEVSYRPTEQGDSGAKCDVSVRAFLADDDNFKEGDAVTVNLVGSYAGYSSTSASTTQHVTLTLKADETQRVTFETGWFPSYAVCGVVVEAIEG